MIDTDITIKTSFHHKSMPVEKLIALLQEHTQAGDMIMANGCGNLSLVRDKNYLGHIDVGQETAVMMDDPA